MTFHPLNCPFCNAPIVVPGLLGQKCPDCGWIAVCRQHNGWVKELTPEGICEPCHRFNEALKQQKQKRRAA